MKLDGEKLTALVMLLIFCITIFLSLSLPAKAAMLPMIVGITGILLCVTQIFFDWRIQSVVPTVDTANSETLMAPDKPREGRAIPESEMFVWLALYTGVLLGFGFLIGGPVLVFLFVRFGSRERILNALIAAAGTFVVLQGIFIMLLGLSLFNGLILEHLL